MLYPRGKPKYVAVVQSLEVYADESGIDADKVCVVCGLVGSSSQWRQVEDRWRRVCGGIVFHGKEFFGRDDFGRRIGVYETWTDAEAAKFLAGLFDALGTSLTLVGGIVDVPAFRALSIGARRYLTMAPYRMHRQAWGTTGAPNRPWFMGFASTLVHSAE